MKNFFFWVAAVACGWVSGRMMELFLPLKALTTITAITIPLIALMTIAEIFRIFRAHRLITKTNKLLQEKIRLQALNTGKDDGS